jgi:hypothetical protein
MSAAHQLCAEALTPTLPTSLSAFSEQHENQGTRTPFVISANVQRRRQRVSRFRRASSSIPTLQATSRDPANTNDIIYCLTTTHFQCFLETIPNLHLWCRYGTCCATEATVEATKKLAIGRSDPHVDAEVRTERGTNMDARRSMMTTMSKSLGMVLIRKVMPHFAASN